jgi:PKD repeat protein
MLSIAIFSNSDPLYVLSADASTDIEILSHNGFLTSSAMYRVVGEVKNIGSKTYKIFLNVTLYDQNDNVITSRIVQTELSAVGPNRTSMFTFQITNSSQSSNVSNYEVTLSDFNETEPKEGKLELQYGYERTKISGYIGNKGNLTNLVTVFATFYDEYGRVVETSSSETILNIESYHDHDFTIYYPPPDISGKNIFSRSKWYALTAESREYAIKEETGLIEFEAPPEPYARFEISPVSNVTVGQIITYDASTSYDLDGNITSYTWDFGDENVTTELDPVITHSYLTNDTYIIKLVVIDNDGLNSTALGYIHIYPSTNNGGFVYLLLLFSGISIAILAIALLMKKRKQKPRRNLKSRINSQYVIRATKTDHLKLIKEKFKISH